MPRPDLAPMHTNAGKVQRLRFAMDRFGQPGWCMNVDLGAIPAREFCDECAATLLDVVGAIVDGRGLPGESADG